MAKFDFEKALKKGQEALGKGQDALEKGVEKAVDKATDYVKEPKSTKDLAQDGAIAIGVGLVLGGGLGPLVAGAAAEAVIVKKLGERAEKKRLEEEAKKGKKPGADDKKGPSAPKP
jgi:hypothetical protein